MHRLIPVINALVISAFTVAALKDSFSIFIMFNIVFGAVGLIFMRRKTNHDRFYVRSSLLTAALCLVTYFAMGIYQGDLATYILFAFVATPAYLSMGYALAVLLYRSKSSSTAV